MIKTSPRSLIQLVDPAVEPGELETVEQEGIRYLGLQSQELVARVCKQPAGHLEMVDILDVPLAHKGELRPFGHGRRFHGTTSLCTFSVVFWALLFPVISDILSMKSPLEGAYDMTQESRKQIDYALSTQAIEKLFPSKAALRLCEDVSSGILSTDEAVAALLKQYGLTQASANG